MYGSAKPWSITNTNIAITSISVGDGIKYIGDNAFHGLDEVAEISLPSSVEAIGDFNFLSCSALTSIELPASLTSLGYGAFNYCTGLTDVVFLGDAPAMESWMFSEVSADCWYPENAEWTDTDLIDYGGTLTWKPFADADGTCGSSVFWKQEEGDVLLIFGEGAMKDYTVISKKPWSAVTKIVVEPGITHVAPMLFIITLSCRRSTCPRRPSPLGENAFRGVERAYCSPITGLPTHVRITEGIWYGMWTAA